MKTAEISAHYMDHMGSDLTVVNAARASFDKESDWAYGLVNEATGKQEKTLLATDANLIGFLARGYRTGEWDKLADTFLLAESRNQVKGMLKAFKNKAQHWAPFGHPHLQLRMTLPVFLARQFVKHQVGSVWSEVSRRYVDDEPTFWFPKQWHTRPDDIKQGSGGLVQHQALVNGYALQATQYALGAYNALLDQGVAPEEARIVLPLNHMTTVVWTGSLLFWARVVNQRVDDHAQLAAQDLGLLISGIVQPHFPVSWAELTTPH